MLICNQRKLNLKANSQVFFLLNIRCISLWLHVTASCPFSSTSRWFSSSQISLHASKLTTGCLTILLPQLTTPATCWSISQPLAFAPVSFLKNPKTESRKKLVHGLALYWNRWIMHPNPKLQNTSPDWNSLLWFLECFPPSGTRADIGRSSLKRRRENSSLLGYTPKVNCFILTYKPDLKWGWSNSSKGNPFF